MKQVQLVTAILLGVFAFGAWAKEKPPEVDSNGLHLVHQSELRVVYKRPGADLSQYDKVILVDPYVAFRKNWERDRRETSVFMLNKNDIEQIKKRVGEEFTKSFTRELGKKGYPVVDKTASGADVLIVRPAIINLDVEAPDTMQAGMNTTVAASAGQMTLYVELYDSVSNQMIGKVMDPEADHGFGGQFMAQNRVTNKQAEDRIVNRWADVLAGHLHHTVTNP
jgi:hypothetical protein